MFHNSFLGKPLRFVGILLMALTGGFTLLGGIGTSCVAINPAGFGESMAALARLQWLYILFVLAGIGIGIWGIRATIRLLKGKTDSYKTSLQALIAGTVVGALHVYVSRMLRGSSMPVDAVVYTTVFTLAVFLLLRIPPIWRSVNFGRGGDNQMAGGTAAIILGLLLLTIQHTMASTHTWGGVNYANAFHSAMIFLGVMHILGGIVYLLRLRLSMYPNHSAIVESGHQPF